jgi:heterodisulfide reductase subunit C2
MTIKISKKTNELELRSLVEEMSGVDLSKCYQCKKCTCGCPVAKITKITPSEIIRRLHLGAGNELLDSDLIWMCLSCETCYSRCPLEINTAAVIDSLRQLALEKKAAVPKGNMPLFNSMFLKTVEAFGRSYDLAMIVGYKLGTGSIMNDTEKFPVMLKKGKMSLLPDSTSGKQVVQRIINRSQHAKGSEK